MAFKLKSPITATPGPMFKNTQKPTQVQATGSTYKNAILNSTANGGTEEITQRPTTNSTIDDLVKKSQSDESLNPRKEMRLKIREDKLLGKQDARFDRQSEAAKRMSQRYFGDAGIVPEQKEKTFMDDPNERNNAAQNESERDFQERMESSKIDNSLGDDLKLADEKPNRAGRSKKSGLLMKMNDTTPLNKKSYKASQKDELMSEISSSPVGFIGLGQIGNIVKGVGNAKEYGGGISGAVKGIGKAMTGGGTDDKLDAILAAVSEDNSTMTQDTALPQDPSALSMNDGFEALPQYVQDKIMNESPASFRPGSNPSKNTKPIARTGEYYSKQNTDYTNASSAKIPLYENSRKINKINLMEGRGPNLDSIQKVNPEGTSNAIKNYYSPENKAQYKEDIKKSETSFSKLNKDEQYKL